MPRLDAAALPAYRALQRHLDRQPVGFPAVRSGADLRLLARLFTPDEARLALFLTSMPQSTAALAAAAAAEFTSAQAAALLAAMLQRRSIGWKQRDGEDCWHLLPLVIGMYEEQDGKPSRAYLRDAGAYLRAPAYGISFIAVRPSQMRTIPVNSAVTAEHAVATYDQLDALVAAAREPIVVLPCICRAASRTRGTTCTVTAREETCIAFGDAAAAVLRRGNGRRITRAEALAIFRENEQDGLVLQPANARRPEFICSCCGCCCGMLAVHKLLPRPLDFWTTSHQLVVTAARCTGCGRCRSRCQVGALTLAGGMVRIDRRRCLGCGLCVGHCPTAALRLTPRPAAAVPPADDEALTAAIAANKRGWPARLLMLAKLALRLPQ